MGQNGLKIGSKWVKMGPNRVHISKMGQNGSKWARMGQNMGHSGTIYGSKRVKMLQKGSK